MSAPTSGSSGSSSAAAPVPGYYPDPSIPHYIRYWNGSAWVPGTSRPAPTGGEEFPPPPAAPVPAQAAVRPPAPAPAPAADESGPMFLDEDPRAPQAHWPGSGAAMDESGPMYLDEGPRAQSPQRPERQAQQRPAPEPPAAAWPAPAQDDPGLPRISWGSPHTPVGPGAPNDPSNSVAQPPDDQAAFPARQPQAGQQPVPLPQAGPRRQPQPQSQPQSQPYPQPQSQPQSYSQPQPQPQSYPQPQSQPQSYPQPQPQAQSQPLPAAAPWANQVRDLARQSGEPVVPWKPLVADPFASAQAQDRPGGLVRRFAARVVDTVVWGAVVAVAAVPLGTAAYHHAKNKVDEAKLTGETVKVWLIDGTTGTQLGVVLVVAVAAGLLLEVLPTAKWGRTLGKKLVGLQVLDIEAQLPPAFGASLRRWLTHSVLDLLVVGLVGLAWCLFDRPWKQCWHDKAARTFVAGG